MNNCIKPLEHIAFIMDGNRRWADAHGFPRVRGHKEGIFAIERIVDGCISNKIGFVTLFAFSTENWNRERPELRYLSRLMYRYLWLLRDGQVGNNLLKKIKIEFVGDTIKFGDRNYNIMNSIEKITEKNHYLRVIVAISYGGRDEIVQAANRAINNGAKFITKISIEDNLYSPDVPFPDLIVRTGDEFRISNFLIWQSAYSELLFVKKYWPDVEAEDIYKYKEIYKNRDRKFGA